MRTALFIATFAFLALSQNVHADDISSTVRGPNSVTPGSIGSTVRSSGASKPDPMLNSNMPVPADAISSTTTNPHQDPMLSSSGGTPKSDAATSTTTGPAVDPKLCNALTKHTPSADVAYQSGVDANGKAVAPADVPGSPQMKLPDKINIPLTVNLAKTLNLDTSQYPYNTLGTGTEAWLGTLSVEGDKVTFNGQPLSDQQQDNLAVLCMKQK